ncbi:hypothetical protein KI387_011975 [Taxus chinensis]|uniref:Nudix hydrolase domain-containing protein n=1 Tax=Taxus chinensis TaxID=29808 RepID=A0AA38CHN9_TAXCH|nr:hypothetical protein KI387_011975 [Taxus chinensis]
MTMMMMGEMSFLFPPMEEPANHRHLGEDGIRQIYGRFPRKGQSPEVNGIPCKDVNPGFGSSPVKYLSWTIPRAAKSRHSFFASPLPPGNEGLMDIFRPPTVNIPVEQEFGLLETSEDEYGGVIIDIKNLHLSVATFVSSLRASLSRWKKKGKRGVWLKLRIENADLVPVAIKEGFRYHHAEPTYTMLTYWIPDGDCMLPPNASHQVGIGAFVINDNREVLAVQEKHGGIEDSQIWKMPTGLIHQSEDIFTGAVREVKEETGIDSDFLEVIAFRHAHHELFDKSDLFFLCGLKPRTLDIVKDDTEIQAAQWMPLQEFASQPLYQEHSMSKKMLDICIAHFEKRYKGFSTFQMYGACDRQPPYFYFNDMDVN